MTQTAHHGDVSARGDWSRVHTDLDWVARWMAERGYSEDDVAYVLAPPAPPAPVPAPLPSHEEAAPEVVAASGERVWTIPLGGLPSVEQASA